MSDIIKKSISANKVSFTEAQLDIIKSKYNIKDFDKEGAIFGKIAVYNNKDLQGEVVRKGAFDKVIEKYHNNDLDVAINIDHDSTKVVGVLKHIIDDYDCQLSNEPSVFGCMKMFETHKKRQLIKNIIVFQ